MKILQVNCVYRKGSTGKIVFDIHAELQRKGVASVVCYGRGDRLDEPSTYKFCSEIEAHLSHLWAELGGLQYASAPIATWRLKRIIKREQPNVVHLHCINGYCVNIYSLLRFLAAHKIKTVVTHHAEFFYTGNCGHSIHCKKWMSAEGCKSCHDLRGATGSRTIDNTHRSWQLMRNAFAAFDKNDLCFTAVSPWVVERSKLSEVLAKYPCLYVTNGVDPSVFHYVENATQLLQGKLPVSGSGFVLHVTASFSTSAKSIKGGRYIVQLARLMPERMFVVVASQVLAVENLPENILLWGRANGQEELAALYSAAEATVLVSERETFSMVTAESLCCGTPVVGFKAGGPESIAIPEYSTFVEHGNIDALQTAVEDYLDSDFDPERISHDAHQVYSKERMTESFIRVYKQLLDIQ